MCAVDPVLSNVELKDYVELGPALPGVPWAYQAVALQELRHRVSDGAADEDSDCPWVPSVGDSWGRGPRMDGAEKVTSTRVS